MDSVTSVGCGYVSKCQSHLIPISMIHGHAKIFIIVSMFLLFSMANSIYRVSLRISGIIGLFQHIFFCELELLNMLSR